MNAYKANVLPSLLSSIVIGKLFAIHHWYYYRTKAIEHTNAKIRISKCIIMLSFRRVGHKYSIIINTQLGIGVLL